MSLSIFSFIDPVGTVRICHKYQDRPVRGQGKILNGQGLPRLLKLILLAPIDAPFVIPAQVSNGAFDGNECLTTINPGYWPLSFTPGL